MNPPLLRAEFDGIQVAIIVLAVLFSAIRWVWENLRGKKADDALPERMQQDEIERQLREAAWRQQTGQSSPPKPAPAQRPADPIVAPRPVARPVSPPSSEASPWEEIRKAWRELREAAQTSSQAPKPAPQPQRAAPSRARPAAAATTRAASTTTVPAAVNEPVTAPIQAAPLAQPVASVSPLLQSLRALRHDPAAMRRAIVLSEVLGTPKGLQS